MRRKSGQMSKNVQVYFLHIIFLRNQTKKKLQSSHCDATVFVCRFFIVDLSQKNGNWKMAEGCRLSPILNFILISQPVPLWKKNLWNEHSCQMIWNSKVIFNHHSQAFVSFFWYLRLGKMNIKPNVKNKNTNVGVIASDI